MSNDEQEILALANSLVVMTRKPSPHTPIVLPNADGSYPEIAPQNIEAMAATEPGNDGNNSGAMAGSVPTVEASAEAVPPSEELGTPAFTAEMAQAILTGQAPPAPAPTPTPTAEDTGLSADALNYQATDNNADTNLGLISDSDASLAVGTVQTSVGISTPEPTGYADSQDEPNLLAGFDPSKYLAGASAPPPLPIPASNDTQKNLVNTGENATGEAQESAYGDIQEGAGQGGQKDSREAMQMLRELSVLKGN